MLKKNFFFRKHSQMWGKYYLLNIRSPFIQVWNQLLHYIQIKEHFLFWSTPNLLNWRPAVQWSFQLWRVFPGFIIPLTVFVIWSLSLNAHLLMDTVSCQATDKLNFWMTLNFVPVQCIRKPLVGFVTRAAVLYSKKLFLTTMNPRVNVKYEPNLASFCLFSSFSQYSDKYSTINGKSIAGVPRIRTLDRRMEGADESTELWRPQNTRVNL